LTPGSAEDEVEHEVRIRVTLRKLGFENPMCPAGQLSGGWQKRLAIGQALVRKPDLLLMDEPTNHLDLPGILWLEQFLRSADLACVVVSHDRIFLERAVTTMMELDPRHRGGLLKVAGGYSAFLQKRAELLASRARYEQSLANKMRRELEWLRRGPKARTTRAASRVQSAEALKDELARMRVQAPGDPAGIEMAATGRKSKRLMVVQGVGKTLGDKTLFRELDLLLRPGLRLGLVGENGSGKTTLLRILAGELTPDAGSVRSLDGLSVVYFAQNREELPPEVSLKRALAPEGDSVVYRDRAVHVTSWARRFSFSTEQMEQPVASLSGGEKAKVAIARLMLRPADVLLLDEPTNDLDIHTLEVLEESLQEFPGAVVLVSHDRYLLDRVCTALLALDGKGQATILADTSQWEALLAASGPEKRKPRPAKDRTRPPRKKGLTYLEKQEFMRMEQAILEAEERLQAAREALDDHVIATDADKLQQVHAELQQAEAEVERLYARWAELDAKRQGIPGDTS
jgi:ATP-binding cassette subfamily F protein uup